MVYNRPYKNWFRHQNDALASINFRRMRTSDVRVGKGRVANVEMRWKLKRSLNSFMRGNKIFRKHIKLAQIDSGHLAGIIRYYICIFAYPQYTPDPKITKCARRVGAKCLDRPYSMDTCRGWKTEFYRRGWPNKKLNRFGLNEFEIYFSYLSRSRSWRNWSKSPKMQSLEAGSPFL